MTKLRTGNYVVTEHLPEGAYHELAEAFIDEGANKGEYGKVSRELWRYFGWDKDAGLYHSDDPELFSGEDERLITYGYGHLCEYKNSAKWDPGEELPPVGTVCEIYECYHKEEHLPDGTKVEILAHYQPRDVGPGVAVFCYEVEGGKQVAQKIKEMFRPLQTHKQKAVKAMHDSVDGFGSATVEEDIYDAIAEGKVPGVKLSHEND